MQGEVEKRGLKMAVVGVPKSIDNDILLVRGLCMSLSRCI